MSLMFDQDNTNIVLFTFKIQTFMLIKVKSYLHHKYVIHLIMKKNSNFFFLLHIIILSYKIVA
jgi:hypothetical protein